MYPHANDRLSVERQHLSRSLIYRWNRVSPFISSRREVGSLQGETMGKRVWDAERSECRFVMKRIGIECWE